MLSKQEKYEAYALAGIGLVIGVGELLLRETVRSYQSAKQLVSVDMDDFNAYIEEIAAEMID